MDSSLKRQAVFLLLLHSAISWTGVEHSIIKTVGENCELPCFGPDGPELIVLEWTKEDKDVLLFREGTVLIGYEHLDYRHRTELLDPQRHGGNLTLLLKNVSLHDSGIYQCMAVYMDGLSISCHDDLTVIEDQDTPQGENPDRNTREFRELILGVSFGLFILVTVLFFMLLKLIISKESQENVKQKMRNSGKMKTSVEEETPQEKKDILFLDSENIMRHDSDCSHSSTSSGESATSTTGLIKRNPV